MFPSTYSRKIPGYVASIPYSIYNRLPSFSWGGDDTEYVEFDAADTEGWVTVQEDVVPAETSWLGNLAGVQVSFTIKYLGLCT